MAVVHCTGLAEYLRRIDAEATDFVWVFRGHPWEAEVQMCRWLECWCWAN